MTAPLFSVIVPTHDRPQLLSECLESIRGQTTGDFECIVVDDGSRYRARIPDDVRFRLIRSPVGGSAARARNTGIDDATGRYVTFLDDDDLYTPDRLAIGLEGVARAAVGLCWTGSVDRPGEVEKGFYEYGSVYDGALDELTHQVATVTLARSDVPKFDEELFASEDIEWWLRIARRFDVHTVPRIGYLRGSHGQARLSDRLLARERDRVVMVQKHRDYFDRFPRPEARLWSRLAWSALHADFRSSQRVSSTEPFGPTHPSRRFE